MQDIFPWLDLLNKIKKGLHILLLQGWRRKAQRLTLSVIYPTLHGYAIVVWWTLYQVVKEFYILTLMGCYYQIMVFSPFKHEFKNYHPSKGTNGDTSLNL